MKNSNRKSTKPTTERPSEGWALFVDDVKDPHTQTIISQYHSLSDWHNAVVWAKTGEEAQEIIGKRGLPNKIYVDGHLGPGMHGRELLDWLKTHHREAMKATRVCVISSDWETAHAMRQFASDVWGEQVLSK